MALLKDLIVYGASRFLADAFGTNIYADKHITNGGTATQFLKGDGTLDSNTYATTSSLSGYVPTSRKVNGQALSADVTLTLDNINDGSSRKLANYVLKAGDTMSGSLTATSFIKSGGTSSQFLKADGSVDSNTYLTSASLTTHAKFADTATAGQVLVSKATNTYEWKTLPTVYDTKINLASNTGTTTQAFTLNSSADRTMTVKGDGTYLTGAVSGSANSVTVTINHVANTTAGTAGQSGASTGVTFNIPYVTYNAGGHITAGGTHEHSITGAQIATILSGQTVGTLTVNNLTVPKTLLIPAHDPSATSSTDTAYLWLGTGLYSEIPGGGSGGGDVYDLTLRKNSVSLGTYNLGTSAADINIPIDWNDLASHPTTLAGYGITDAASASDLAGYLPLSAGSGKALTGDLHIGTSAPAIYGKIGDSYHSIFMCSASGNMSIFADSRALGKSLYINGRAIYFSTGSSGQNSQITHDSNGFYPYTTNVMSLGTSSYKWKEVYATTIYGKLDLSYVQSASDLKAIEALTGTGLAKRTSDNTWELTDTADKAEELATFSEEDAMFTYRQVPSEAVGDVCKTTAVKGKSVVWNQLLPELVSTNWRKESGVSMTNSTGYATIAVTTANHGIYVPFTFIVGHKYYLTYSARSSSAFTLRQGTASSGVYIDLPIPSTNVWTRGAGVLTCTHGGNLFYCYPVGTGTFDLKDIACIDLTIAGFDDLTAAEFEALYPDYHSYNAGELVNNAASGVEMVGFNQWDEEWEVGGLDASGQNDTLTNRLRAKNYIPCAGNTAYYFFCGETNSGTFCYYDTAKNFISSDTTGANRIKTTPANAAYIRFYIYKSGITTYGNNICINISDPSLNGQYKPYRTDTLSTPIIEIVPADKPTVRLNQLVQNGDFSDSLVLWTNTGYLSAISISQGELVVEATRTSGLWLHYAVRIPANHKIYCRIKARSQAEISLTARLTGSGNTNRGLGNVGTAPVVLSTIFSATYDSTDFSIYSGDTTVGNKAYFDTIILIDLTEMYGAGNEPTSTAEVEELIGADYIPYTTGEDIPNRIFPKGMKSAGSVADEWSGTTATKRIGVMDLGTLSWVRRLYSNAYFFIVELPSLALRTPYNTNLLCPQYDTGKTSNLDNNVPDKTIIAAGYTSTTAGLFVRNDSYTSAATFKAAMSGVLLYYELATPVTYTTDQPLPGTLAAFDEGGTQKVIPTYDIVSGGEKVFPDGPKYINESVYDEYYDTTAIKRVGVVDLGTLNYTVMPYSSGGHAFMSTVSDGITHRGYGGYNSTPCVCSRYTMSAQASEANMSDKTIAVCKWTGACGAVNIVDSAFDNSDVATFKAAMSGVLLYYELAEPITYTLDHTLVQAPIVCDFQYGANMSDLLTSYTETDPVFSASAAAGITSGNISAWNGKQDAISDLATIRSNASTAATAVDVQQGSGLGIDNNGHLTLDSHDAADVLELGSAAFKGYDTAVTSGSANLVTSGAVYTAVSAKYTKPSTGIPKTDLASAVQTTLTNADTAYGWGNHANAGYLTSFTETDPTVPAWAKQSSKPTYTLDEVADGSTRKLANYLPLTGGTLAKAAGTSGNILDINNTTASSNVWTYYKVAGANKAAIGYYTNFAFISNEASSGKARIGVADNGTPQYWPAYNSAAANRYTLWHANNSNLATVSWSALNLSAAGTLSVTSTSTLTGAVTCSNNLSVASGLVTAQDLTVTRNLVIPKVAPTSPDSTKYYLYINPNGNYSE